MSFSLGTTVSGIVDKVLDRVIPDPVQRAAAQLEKDKLDQTGELARLAAETDLAKGQQAINQLEAQSADPFVSRWRPAAGWVCVIALAMSYIPKALVLTIAWCFQAYAIMSNWDTVNPLSLPDFPNLGVTDLIGLLGTLLGVGAMRSWEKGKGVAAK